MSGFKKLPTHILRDACFESLIKSWKPGTFLEIGPGFGHTTKIFLRKGFHGTCYDISKESREILSVNLKEYYSRFTIIGDLSAIKKRSYDYLFIFDVIEHIEDDARMLQEFTEYLKEGGILLISVPAHKKAFCRSDELVGHYRRYEKDDFCNLIERCGYFGIKIFNYGFPLVNWTLWGINFLYRFLSNKVDSEYVQLSLPERTKNSGVKNPHIAYALSVFFNRFTLLPFIFLQKLFLNQDWGVAYIAYAKKT